jgi:hypothetical protein
MKFFNRRLNNGVDEKIHRLGREFKMQCWKQRTVKMVDFPEWVFCGLSKTGDAMSRKQAVTKRQVTLHF